MIRVRLLDMAQFDVFISCRQTDASNQPTRDSSLARDVYEFLSARGLRPFLAQETLPTVGQPEYMQVIDKALDEAAVLVTVGTSVENLESRWVRYEWET